MIIPMKTVISPLLALLAFFFMANQVQAVCPICTVAVAGGLGISRWLGIDDAVTGVWVGGLILSSAFWLSDFIRKKNWKIFHPDLVSVVLFYLLVIPPLYWANYIGLLNNSLWGVDKVLLGTILGSIAFLSGIVFDKILRKINDGEQFVYFQKVIIPVLTLTLISFGLFLITK